MSPRTRTRLATVALVAATWAGPARAQQGVSQEDHQRLIKGETLVYEQTLESDRRRYIGGVCYTLVDARPEEMAGVFEDTRAWRAILPRTKSARIVVPPGLRGEDARRDFWVELRQGNALVDAVYTLRVRPGEDGLGYRFWLDPRMDHDIADAWGFFRFEAVQAGPGDAQRVLLTFGVLVDVGDGLVRVFEEKVRPVLLSVPGLVRGYMTTQRHAKKT